MFFKKFGKEGRTVTVANKGISRHTISLSQC